MKIHVLLTFLILRLFLPITAHSQELIKGIELGVQTAIPHYFSWGHYGEEEIDLLRPYVQSNVTSFANGFIEKRLNAVLSLRAGLLLHQVTFSRLASAEEVPVILNPLHVDNRFYRSSTHHRLGVPISLKTAVSSRFTIGAGVHVSRTFLSTASGWNDRIFPGNNPRRIQVQPRLLQIPDFHLASFMTASYQLMNFSSRPLFLTVTGEYDHRWSMPVFNGINYRLIRLGLGVEWRFE